MHTLRIDLPGNVDPQTIVGVVDGKNTCSTWCGLCLKRLTPGEAYLCLFDGDEELCAVCESCNAKDGDEIQRTAAHGLRLIDDETGRVRRIREMLARIQQGETSIKRLSLLDFANSVRRVQQDMNNWKPDPDAATCCDRPF